MLASNISRTDILMIETLRALPGMNGERVLDTIRKSGSVEDILLRTKAFQQGNSFQKAISRAEEIRHLSAERGLRSLTYFEEGYPAWLKHQLSPPPAIYFKGNLNVLGRLIGLSGSLSPTKVGLLLATRMAKEITGRGWSLLTGLNPGIERIATETAIAENGPVCIVLSTGFDKLRTVEIRLCETVLNQGGIVLTEIPVGQEVEKRNLVLSKRICAGLFSGLFVVEPTHRETSHLMRFALNSRRPILVPRLPEPFRSAPENVVAEDLVNVAPDQIYPRIPVFGSDPTTVRTILRFFTEKNRTSIGYPISSRDEYPEVFSRLESFHSNLQKAIGSPI